MADKYAHGYLGYVGIGTQSALLTGVSATTFLGVTSADIKEIHEPRQRTGNIQKSRFGLSHTIGRIEVAGTINFEVVADDIEPFFAYLLSNDNTVSGDATTGYTHTFNQEDPSDDAKLYSQNGATIEVFLGGAGGQTSETLYDHIGCFVSKMSITIPTEGIITGTMDIVGVKSETAGSLSAPTFSIVSPYEGYMAQVSIGAAIGSVSAVEVNGDITIEIDNQTQMVKGHNTTQYPVGRTQGMFLASVSFETRIQNDLTLAGYFTNNDVKALQIALNHPTQAGSSSGDYSITFKFPRCFFSDGIPSLNGPEEITQPVKLEAEQDATAGYTCQILAVNTTSGTYAA